MPAPRLFSRSAIARTSGRPQVERRINIKTQHPDAATVLLQLPLLINMHEHVSKCQAHNVQLDNDANADALQQKLLGTYARPHEAEDGWGLSKDQPIDQEKLILALPP